MLKTKFAGLAGLSLLGWLNAAQTQAQGLGNSPYSRLGLGDAYINTGGVRQMAMGGVGLAAPNGTNVNELNPALVYYTSRTTYEVAVTGQFKTISNRTNSQRDGSGTLGYLALAFPISKRWAAAAGLRPYTAVDYESTTSSSVTGDPNAQSINRFTGDGGLSEAYMVHAFRIAKGLTVGGTASYVFGTIDATSGTTVVTSGDNSNVQSTVRLEHVRYSDFIFRAGAHYRGKLTDKLNYNLAAVYGFQSNLNGTYDVTQEQRTLAGAPIANTSIVLVSGQKGEARVPTLAQFGISLDNNRNWSTSLDLARQQWSRFQVPVLAGVTSAANVPLSDTYRVGLGGEWAPDPTSVDNYFKRVVYRAGISLAEVPYRPGGQRLYDRAVSWGFGFPIPGATPLDATTFSLAFTYGQRGNNNVTIDSPSGNVKENYIRMQVGVSLNNRWFIKRRIE
ncbi:OmpP1/FadL family transporter [Hymenobacter defluvii]|uniref:Long-subunit fatty acid transport protein n=1 Tax=Hymenobacter defluvii TaxID=2054411 RepID=A0ABS3TI09_9BACT|nr:hypothetical protein [Hymenobacter defluvii]MBO3273301.1 hypothetical protein [Hymenobacter defluvii]